MTTFNIQSLIKLIEDVCEQDELAEISVGLADVNTSFDDLGLDSLALLSVVAQLEQQTGVKIGLEAATTATTPAELCALVEQRLGAAEKAA